MTERTPQRRNSKRSLKPRVERNSEGHLVAEFIETFCRLSKGDGAGKLIKLRLWQREILDELFELKEDGRRRKRRGLLLLPRKNGKSLLASGIALYSLFTEVGAYVGVVASGTATAGGITSDTNATGNASPVATATLETSGGTVVIHCAVAASGSDFDMTNGLTVASGDTVSCSALTYAALSA